jgi:dipeptidyl aminopeptidase/acylaminoacyl peptidase
MTLAPDERLGAYEILSPLGAGGMGEVYRGRDTRLGREVALKILPAELAEEKERLSRFDQEARAASALNHPNIVTIYEVGFSGERPFLAMELVEGKTLRELVVAGPLALRRVFSVGAQVAEGLAKAHAAGIVHRDLKPENVMVSKDGFVKILDFGLAKLTEPGPGGASAALTLARPDTHPGTVLGTVAYMSPEQASGEAIDFRSDQFSLGSILYELTTGQKPFQRRTAAETMSAIIREEPEPLGKVRPEAPLPARWILERCLAKDPEERYGSTRDLARDLASLRDHISEVSSGAEAVLSAPTGRRRHLPLLTALAVVGAGVAGWFAALGRPRAVPPVPSFKRLTFRGGMLGNARFAPDGQTVFYGATWEGEVGRRLYMTRPESPESRRLELPPGTDILAISRSGELAILLGHTPDKGGTLAKVPMAGGIPRQILERVPHSGADWSPDGRELAVVVRDVDGKTRLESPIGKVILRSPPVGSRLPGRQGLASPRFSPTGDLIAFWELGESASVGVIDPSGKAKRTLTADWSNATGVPCWRSDGAEVWFTAARPGEPAALWAVDRSTKLRLVARVPGMLELYDISRDGRVLLAQHNLRSLLHGVEPGASEERELSWLDHSMPSDLSLDGRTLLLTERGEGAGAAPAVYVRGVDGSPAVRLGEGLGMALAPDGKRVLAKVEPGRGKPDALVLLPTGPGETETLKTGSFTVFGWGAFLPEGRGIVFSARAAQGPWRIYALDLSGGKPRPIGPEGTTIWQFSSPVSPDGRFVIGHRPSAKWPELPSIIPVAGGEPREIPDWTGGVPAQWAADGRALYVYRAPERQVWLVDVQTGKARLWKELPRITGWGGHLSRFRITPAGRAYVYTTTQASSELYLVEGLR